MGTIGAAIVNPVGDQGSDSNVTTLDADELATVVGLTTPEVDITLTLLRNRGAIGGY